MNALFSRFSFFWSIFAFCLLVLALIPFWECQRKNENVLILSFLLWEYKNDLKTPYSFERTIELDGKKHLITIKRDQNMRLLRAEFAVKGQAEQKYVYEKGKISEEKLQDLLEKNEVRFNKAFDVYKFKGPNKIIVSLSEDRQILKIEEAQKEALEERNAFYFNSLGKLVQSFDSQGKNIEIVYNRDKNKIASILRSNSKVKA